MKNKQQDRGSKMNLVALLIGTNVLLAASLLAHVAYVEYSKFNNEPDFENAVRAMESLPGLVGGVNPVAHTGLPQDEARAAASSYRQVPGLVDTLRSYAKDRPCPHLQGRFKQYVLGVTADQTQALIGSGCGGNGVVRSFVIKQGDAWVRVGSGSDASTGDQYFNQLLDMPSCALVERHNIQTSIAPICYEKADGKSDLYSGDIVNYQYKLRQ